MQLLLQTTENFRQLCTGEAGMGKSSGKPLHFKDSCFHRVRGHIALTSACMDSMLWQCIDHL